jgi:hypothetical protein
LDWRLIRGAEWVRVDVDSFLRTGQGIDTMTEGAKMNGDDVRSIIWLKTMFPESAWRHGCLSKSRPWAYLVKGLDINGSQ